MIRKSGYRFSEKITLKQEAKANWQVQLNSFRFSASARPVKESKSRHCGPLEGRFRRRDGRLLPAKGGWRRRCRCDHECIAAVLDLWFGGTEIPYRGEACQGHRAAQ
jgi:hypothetical protein